MKREEIKKVLANKKDRAVMKTNADMEKLVKKLRDEADYLSSFLQDSSTLSLIAKATIFAEEARNLACLEVELYKDLELLKSHAEIEDILEAFELEEH